jgi:hypothetical protein
MDISTIQPVCRPYNVRHPATEEPTGLIFMLRPDSAPEVRKFDRDWQNGQLRKRKMHLTAEGLENRNIGRTVASVESWDWSQTELDWQGGKPDFTEATLRSMLKALPWLQKQLDDELGNDAAFFQS